MKMLSPPSRFWVPRCPCYTALCALRCPCSAVFVLSPRHTLRCSPAHTYFATALADSNAGDGSATYTHSYTHTETYHDTHTDTGIEAHTDLDPELHVRLGLGEPEVAVRLPLASCLLRLRRREIAGTTSAHAYRHTDTHPDTHTETHTWRRVLSES